jgi:hypothetical protein
MYQAGSNHGTSCAGVIAGEVDALLTVGTAPGCLLLPVKWELSEPYRYNRPGELPDNLIAHFNTAKNRRLGHLRRQTVQRLVEITYLQP